MMFNATYFSCIVEVSFFWRNPGNPEKTTDLPQVTDELYHIMLYRVNLAINWVWPQNFIGDKYWLHM